MAEKENIKAFQSGDKQVTKIIALEISLYIKSKNLIGILIPSPSRGSKILKLVQLISQKTGLKYKNVLFKKYPFSNCELRRNDKHPFTIDQLKQLIRVKKSSIRNAIIIDDVCTSGNTLKACMELLNCKSRAIAYTNGSRK